MADFLPLVTALVCFALTFLLVLQYRQRHKVYQAVWAASLGLLGIAAVVAFLGNPDILGWSEGLYKVYLPLTALPVGLIGLGVLQLFRNRPAAARAYGYYWVATAVLVLLVTAVAPVTDAAGLATQGPAVGGRYLPLFGAVSWLQTLPGALVFIVGGVYSWWMDRSRAYGLLFALGGILFTVAGFSSRFGVPSAFFLITALAAFVTFLGFVWSVEHTVPVARPAKA